MHELAANDIDPASVSFDDDFKDGYGIRKVYYRWEIFFRERGSEFYSMGYPSESEALTALLNAILHHL